MIRAIASRKWAVLGLVALFVPLAWRAYSKVKAAYFPAEISAVQASAAPVPAPVPVVSTPPSSPIVASASAGPSLADLAFFSQQEERRQLPIERDPFRSFPELKASPKAEPLVGLRLEGVSMKGSRALAVINDRVIGEGEEVDGFEVEAIGRDRVTLKRGEQQVELELERTLVKDGR